MNLNIKKEDLSINPDGSIAILNPDLKGLLERITADNLTEIDKLAMADKNGNCHCAEK